MPCCIALLALAAPRIALVLVWLFAHDWLDRAFATLWVPLLGFFFLPTTTLAYAWSMNAYGGVSGLGLAAVILGALIDVGALGGSRRKRKKHD